MKEFKKLTENDIADIIENEESITNHLTAKVAELYTTTTSDLSMDFEYCLSDCESPIEQMLAIQIERLFRHREMDIPLLVDVVAVEKQVQIECKDKKYRVDFLIPVIYWNNKKCFVIECDGHEFHQKTKEQVERDNVRTRELQLLGYTVIRFSGTEIFHRPYLCACEIKRIIQAPAIEFLKGVVNE